MTIFDKLKSLTSITSITKSNTKKDYVPLANHTGGFRYYGQSNNEYIPMKILMNYYNSSPRLRLTVNTNTNFAVGDGFHLKADDTDKLAQGHKQLLEEYCQEINMERLAQAISVEAFATGNAFLMHDGDTLRHFPASQVDDIYHDDGIPNEYRIHHVAYGERSRQDQTEEHLTPDEIIHFRMNTLPGTPWGRSIGHIYVAGGVGFRDASSKVIRRMSFAQIDEMIEDSLAKVTHRGLPRWLISSDTISEETTTDIEGFLDTMEIGQHFLASGGDVKMDIMELGSRANWTEFLTTLDRHISWCMQSPVATLFAEPDKFAYASSREAAALMFPGIDMYQRLLKEFVEQQIFKPYVEANSKHSWDKYPVEINFGREETTDINNIIKLDQLRRNGLPISPNSIIKMLQQSGFSIETPKETMSPEMAARAAKKKQPLDPNAKLRRKMEEALDDMNTNVSKDKRTS